MLENLANLKNFHANCISRDGPNISVNDGFGEFHVNYIMSHDELHDFSRKQCMVPSF